MSDSRGQTMPDEHERALYWSGRAWLNYAMHELPRGVLYGANSASIKECEEMLRDFDRFEQLCIRFGLDDHQEFLDACRWHLEHYAHYLGRRRHFADYPAYTEDRGGPMRVNDPPSPPKWLSKPSAPRLPHTCERSRTLRPPDRHGEGRGPFGGWPGSGREAWAP